MTFTVTLLALTVIVLNVQVFAATKSREKQSGHFTITSSAGVGLLKARQSESSSDYSCSKAEDSL
jgi:hypothetical protein